jgi:segregation and condensation protein B
MSEDNLKPVVEAMLLASAKPLAADQIRQAVGASLNEVRKAIDELRSEYEITKRGIRVIEIAGGFQMITAPDYAVFLKKLFKGRATQNLSRPALETLAIIAYKQPLTRQEIELLRNVDVDGVMKSLQEKNMIRVAGRKKTPGRPKVYGTTREFLEHFGLKSLEDLPKMEDFTKMAEKKAGEAGVDDIELIPEGTNELKEAAQQN